MRLQDIVLQDAESEKENLYLENLGEFAQKAQPFFELMMYYNCAMNEVRTKVEVLNMEFSTRFRRNPVENIKTRLKKPISILKKLEKYELPKGLDEIKENIYDVAGVRIICSFVKDIYAIADMLAAQDDVTIMEVKDYIKHPKDNGYRSLHLIVKIPIFLSSGKMYVPVEIQIRTVAMDFWASVEHKIKYKNDSCEKESITERLRLAADKISELDLEMQNIEKAING